MCGCIYCHVRAFALVWAIIPPHARVTRLLNMPRVGRNRRNGAQYPTFTVWQTIVTFTVCLSTAYRFHVRLE